MPTARFLTLDDVADVLNVSWSQVYALVRRKELIAIQIGGRGQWRGENEELEGFISPKEAGGRAGTPPHETQAAAPPQAPPQATPPGPPTGKERGPR